MLCLRMNSAAETKDRQHLSECLIAGGFRFTSQRRCVYDVLLNKRDHPTAEDVFTRARVKI